MRLLMSIVWWSKKPLVLGKNGAMKLMLRKYDNEKLQKKTNC